jgi:flavin-binding protein dodecin
MAGPFQRAQESQGRSSQLLGRRSSMTLEAIEDLLAEAACVRDVTSAAVSDLCTARKIDLRNRLHRGRRQLYHRYLKHCFEDRVLSPEEIDELSHLRDLLHLDAADLSAVQDAVAVEVYGEAVEEVLADFRLDDDEAAFLRDLTESLHLSEDTAKRIYGEGAGRARDRVLRDAGTRDRQFLEHRVPAGEFTGRSDASLERAIDDALTKASLAIPSLHWFEVTHIAGYVEDGRANGWHATLKAGIRSDEEGGAR